MLVDELDAELPVDVLLVELLLDESDFAGSLAVLLPLRESVR